MLTTTVLYRLLDPGPLAQQPEAKKFRVWQTALVAPAVAQGPLEQYMAPRESYQCHGVGYGAQGPRGPQAEVVRIVLGRLWKPYPSSQEDIPEWQEMSVLSLQVEALIISL